MSYEYVKRWRQRVKRRAVDSLGGECCICGYKRCLKALLFHHLEKETKEFDISGMKVNNWEKIVKELRKCVCVCKNCHTEIHEGITEVPKNAQRFDESYVEYKNPIKKEYNECPVCNGQKEKRLKVCSQECAARLRCKIDWNSVDLEKLLKSTLPLERIAEKLGVSGNAVRKRLRKLGLPVSLKERKKWAYSSAR